MCNNSGGGGGGGGGGGAATRKGPWTEQEDAQLVWFVRLLGERRWDFLAQVSGLRRTGKSCRLRWVNYLHPDLKRGRITAEEERLILHLHAEWGSRWSRIARKLPGRTDNEIKNYWRTHMRKKAQEEKLMMTKKKNAATPAASPSSSSSSSSSSSYDDDDVATAASSSSASASVATSCPEALQETTSSRDEEAEEEEAATTAASEQQQQEMDRLWDEIAAAESYAEMSWGAGHVAVDAAVEPSSPVWEFCADYSLWRIDDEEYYNKMEHTHAMN